MSFDVTLKTPCSMLACGPSQSGKTRYIMELLRHKMTLFDPPPQHVTLFYQEPQSAVDQMLKEGLVDEAHLKVPDFDEVRKLARKHKKISSMIIFDDCNELFEKEGMAMLFTRVVHHSRCSMLVVNQSLYDTRSRNLRLMSLNANYIWLWKFPRDETIAASLGRQFRPHEPGFVVWAFNQATNVPYSPLLLDLHSFQSDGCRVRARILPNEQPMINFLPLSFFKK